MAAGCSKRFGFGSTVICCFRRLRFRHMLGSKNQPISAESINLMDENHGISCRLSVTIKVNLAASRAALRKHESRTTGRIALFWVFVYLDLRRNCDPLGSPCNGLGRIGSPFPGFMHGYPIYNWVNYNDLTTTSLDSWLVREIISKWPQDSG
jgi:hypothetical protein